MSLTNSSDKKPSLLQGSAQTVKISKVKTNVNDKTVSMSILIVRAPNADFDGDAINFSIAIDNEMARHWESLAPHKNIFVLNSPREMSGNHSLPKPVVSTISKFLLGKPTQPSQERLMRFNMLPDA